MSADPTVVDAELDAEGSDDTSDDTGREAAIEAARAALAEADDEPSANDNDRADPKTAKADKPVAEVVKDPAVDEEEEAPKDESKMGRLARELKERTKLKGIEAELAEKRDAIEQQYSEGERFLSDAKQEYQRITTEINGLKKLFKDDPEKALKALGWDADQIIKFSLEKAERDRDPNYRSQTAWTTEKDELLAQIRTQQEQINEIKEYRDNYERQRVEQAQTATVEKMLSFFDDESPARQLGWDDEYILAQCNKTQVAYKAKTKSLASYEDLAEYINAQAEEKLQRLTGVKVTPNQSQGSGQRIAGKSKANGSRALTTRDASEHRGAPPQKHVDDMTPDEERQYIKAEVERAMRGAS